MQVKYAFNSWLCSSCSPELNENRPFCSCWLSDLAFKWQRGWRWPCFDTDLTAIQRPGHWADNCKMVYYHLQDYRGYFHLPLPNFHFHLPRNKIYLPQTGDFRVKLLLTLKSVLHHKTSTIKQLSGRYTGCICVAKITLGNTGSGWVLTLCISWHWYPGPMF